MNAQMNSAIGICLTGLSALFTTTSAQAADYKIFSGTVCQPTYERNVDDIRYHDRSINNIRDFNVWVTCPVTRNNPANTNGILQSYVRVYDAPSDSWHFICYFNTCNTSGSCRYDSDVSTNGWDWMPLKVTSSYAWGPYTVSCRIPPKSSLYHIRLGEYNTR